MSERSDQPRISPASAVALPSGTPAWVTPTLLESTIRLWSRRFGAPVSSADAIGILVRVGHLLDVLAPPSPARIRATRRAESPDKSE